MPSARKVMWEDTELRGPLLCALCFGNANYKDETFCDLPNCVNDAERVAKQARKVSDNAVVKVERNLPDKKAMIQALENFLFRRPPLHTPRIVLIYFSGHGIQAGHRLFLVPTGFAGPNSEVELNGKCLSHEEVFEILERFHTSNRTAAAEGSFLPSRTISE